MNEPLYASLPPDARSRAARLCAPARRAPFRQDIYRIKCERRFASFPFCANFLYRIISIDWQRDKREARTRPGIVETPLCGAQRFA